MHDFIIHQSFFLLIAVFGSNEYNGYVKSSINIDHLAKLANLPLTPEELAKFEQQLQETLNYVDQLQKIDTEGIEPTSQVTGLENVTRSDETAPSLSQEEATKNAKNTHNGLFKVTAIFDKE